MSESQHIEWKESWRDEYQGQYHYRSGSTKQESSGAPIQISVYPNKLMIWNSGVLPPDWDVDKLLGKHSSKPFNPDIANTFFRTGSVLGRAMAAVGE